MLVSSMKLQGVVREGYRGYVSLPEAPGFGAGGSPGCVPLNDFIGAL